jgi:hypothetical protein
MAKYVGMHERKHRNTNCRNLDELEIKISNFTAEAQKARRTTLIFLSAFLRVSVYGPFWLVPALSQEQGATEGYVSAVG